MNKYVLAAGLMKEILLRKKNGTGKSSTRQDNRCGKGFNEENNWLRKVSPERTIRLSSLQSCQYCLDISILIVLLVQVLPSNYTARHTNTFKYLLSSSAV